VVCWSFYIGGKRRRTTNKQPGGKGKKRRNERKGNRPDNKFGLRKGIGGENHEKATKTEKTQPIGGEERIGKGFGGGQEGKINGVLDASGNKCQSRAKGKIGSLGRTGGKQECTQNPVVSGTEHEGIGRKNDTDRPQTDLKNREGKGEKFFL